MVLNIQEVVVCGVWVVLIIDFVGVKVIELGVEDVFVLFECYMLVQLIVVVILLQLLVYYVVLFKGIDVDQLWNLVKFVIVE